MATEPRFRTIQGGKPKDAAKKEKPRSLLGARIRDHRNAAGLSQKELAEKVKVKPPYICEIETGAKNPSNNLCISIAQVLGTDSVEYIDLLIKEREKNIPQEVRDRLTEFKAAKARYDEETETFLDDYRSLDKETRACIRALVGRMVDYLRSGGKKT